MELVKMDDSGVLVEAEHEVRKLSPRDAYIGFCLRRDCKPILAVASLFSNVAGDWSSDDGVDLSTTYVGPRGILAVCDTCRLLTQLRHIDFSDNYVTNACAPAIADLLRTHPSLERLELAGNRYLSWTAAMYFASAISENSRITYIGLLRTSVDTETRDGLFALTHRNALGRFAKRVPSAPRSTHQHAVQLRAIRHYFLSVADENGTVLASRLRDGRRERRLLQGLGAEDTSETDRYDEEENDSLAWGTSDEVITWNQFLVLVMLDGTVYDEHLVRSLADVFERFNMLPAQGLVGGVVEVSDFAHILSTLYSLPPKGRDVATLKKKLGLDDTMIVTWDEFLYTFYHSPSDMGAGLTGCVATPVPDQTRVFHY